VRRRENSTFFRSGKVSLGSKHEHFGWFELAGARINCVTEYLECRDSKQRCVGEFTKYCRYCSGLSVDADKNIAHWASDLATVGKSKSLLRIWADPELIESGSWNHAENGACIRNKVKLLPMSLVAWIADLYSYFCDSHRLDFTITSTQRQRPAR
jgi:hypothetical protein